MSVFFVFVSLHHLSPWAFFSSFRFLASIDSALLQLDCGFRVSDYLTWRYKSPLLSFFPSLPLLRETTLLEHQVATFGTLRCNSAAADKLCCSTQVYLMGLLLPLRVVLENILHEQQASKASHTAHLSALENGKCLSCAGWWSMQSKPISIEKTTTWVRLNLSM